MNGKSSAKAARQIDTSFETALMQYFDALDGEEPSNLYDMVIGRAERALFASVMDRAQGNQTRAAKMLGLSRTTLRNKLLVYKLI
ncbi:MAG: Fis family transcriptional regulator [Burkholderiales bacterium]|jgi:Fis family transcriptional regulator|nr:Fis family transcriptional regulator [Burkholderiales bacterium]